MKLTAEDKELLSDWGFPEDDFEQIEEAMKKKYTKYALLINDKADQPITREEAIQLLGRESYLSGITRSAFHWSSVRSNGKGKSVYFKSHDLFKN